MASKRTIPSPLIVRGVGVDPKPGKNTVRQSKLFRKTISEKNFYLWAASFGPEVEEVLVSADDGEWGDHNPSRDCYVRFGWRNQMPARHIAGWWQWSIRELQRDLSTGAISKQSRSTLIAFTEAFNELMAVL